LLFAVAAVGGGRGVEIQAEDGEGHRRWRCGLGDGGEVQAGQRKLHAGGQRGVEVNVVVGGADHLMDLREHGHQALRRRRWRGQDAQRASTPLLVRAVGDQAVQVAAIAGRLAGRRMAEGTAPPAAAHWFARPARGAGTDVRCDHQQ
jgi:hypothetical protein